MIDNFDSRLDQSMSQHRESGCLIVQIKNRFDEKNHSQIQDAISECLKEEFAHLILDLNNISLIRSSGLRVILFFAKHFQNKDKKFATVYSKNDDNYQVSQILKVSGFSEIISIHATTKDAITHCNSNSS